MGKIVDGRYIYSMDDCRCDFCIYYGSKTRLCQVNECLCHKEKGEALLYFPPYGFE